MILATTDGVSIHRQSRQARTVDIFNILNGGSLSVLRGRFLLTEELLPLGLFRKLLLVDFLQAVSLGLLSHLFFSF